jgi:uncharacterized membrane protein YkoI
MKRSIKVALIIGALSTTGAIGAYASKTEVNDAEAIQHAGISLTQAIQAAEQHLHGKAVRAEFEHGKKGWVFDVEVVADSRTYDVAVDPAKGTVIAAQADKADHDDHNDRED